MKVNSGVTLNPCPCCGNNARMIGFEDKKMVVRYAECETCGLQTRSFYTSIPRNMCPSCKEKEYINLEKRVADFWNERIMSDGETSNRR